MTKEREMLEAVVNVRLTKAEKDKLKEDAEIAGLSVSELVRRRYFGRKIVAKTDSAVLKELRRLGGLLKYVHVDSGGLYRQEVTEALKSLKNYFDYLSRDSQENWES